MTRAVLALLLALAACDAAPPRVDTAGTAARAEVDAATKLYAECIAGHADAIPLPDDGAGSIVDSIVRSCKPARVDLIAKVAAFDRIGHPKHRPDQAEAVAEASVLTIEDELRQAAVVAIIKRQGEDAETAKGTKI